MVSVVTPARNAAATLPRTIASVAGQRSARIEHVVVTHPQDLQTAGVVARHPHLRHVVAAANSAGEARNHGLAAARGRYVLFLDADDTIASGHVARLLRASLAERADIVFGGYRRRDAQGRVVQRRGCAPGPVAPETLRRGPPTALHAILFARDMLVGIDGFDAALTTNEDWDLVLRAATAGARVHAITGASADYWITPGSLSGNGARMMADRMQVAQLAHDAVPGEPSSPEVCADALRTALWTGAGAIARGEKTGGIVDALAELQPMPPFALDVDEGAAALLDGLAIGFACSYGEIVRRMEGRWSALESFCGEVAAMAGEEGLDHALVRALERELARVGPAGRRYRIGHTQVVPALAGLRQVPRADSWAQQVVVRYPLVRPRSLATLAFAPTVAEKRSALALAGRRALGWLAERESPLRDKALRAAVLARRVLGRAPEQQPPEAREDLEGAGDWEGVFSSENPWGYHRTYEQAKYTRTLALLPETRIGRALELACAEGHFTQMLAPRVAHLTASDISATALERCRERCEALGLNDIEYRELDFFDNDFGTGWDLIVSSEVLYYMGSTERLERYAARVAAGLVEGGLFLHAHAYQVSDTPEHSGFDWGDKFAAGTISRCFTGNPDLVREKAIETELYRIELYRKATGQGGPAKAAAPAELSMKHELDAALAGDVVWNGAILTRTAAEAERHTRIPVLMYHSIAEDGPAGLAPWRTTPEDFAHQLRFLRRRGYRPVTLDEWDESAARSGRVSGRPVLITFDDGLQDFADNAWPILQHNGFSALMFAVAGEIGKAAHWDGFHGAPRPLMDWQTLARLAEEGLEVGSHCLRHVPLDRLDPATIMADAKAARALFEQHLGHVPSAVAPPYGICDRQHAELLLRCGYERVFMAAGGAAPVSGGRHAVPRIEIAGGIGIDQFARLVGASEPPEEADRP